VQRSKTIRNAASVASVSVIFVLHVRISRSGLLFIASLILSDATLGIKALRQAPAISKSLSSSHKQTHDSDKLSAPNLAATNSQLNHDRTSNRVTGICNQIKLMQN